MVDNDDDCDDQDGQDDGDDQKDINKEEGMEIDLLRVGNKSEIRRILEMTVSDDKEREDREEYTHYHY